MSEAQRARAHTLLKAGLSQRGYMTATAIMELESLLGALEQREREGGRQAEGFQRDPVRYFFSVFGTPSAKGKWGWRVEGHHVSLHFTMANGTAVASSPAMFGSNPAEVLDGPRKGTRILAAEEDTRAGTADGARPGTARTGGDQRRGAERHGHQQSAQRHAAFAGRRRGVRSHRARSASS